MDSVLKLLDIVESTTKLRETPNQWLHMALVLDVVAELNRAVSPTLFLPDSSNLTFKCAKTMNWPWLGWACCPLLEGMKCTSQLATWWVDSGNVAQSCWNCSFEPNGFPSMIIRGCWWSCGRIWVMDCGFGILASRVSRILDKNCSTTTEVSVCGGGVLVMGKPLMLVFIVFINLSGPTGLPQLADLIQWWVVTCSGLSTDAWLSIAEENLIWKKRWALWENRRVGGNDESFQWESWQVL